MAWFARYTCAYWNYDNKHKSTIIRENVMFGAGILSRWTLSIILLLLATPVLACPTSRDLSGLIKDANAALADCAELARFDIPTGRGTVRGTIFGSLDSDLSDVRATEEALQNAGEALRKIGRLSTLPIEVDLTPIPISGDGSAIEDAGVSARSFDSGAGNPPTCIIVISNTLGAAGYNFVIAHEFFHCVQDCEFNESIQLVEADWWGKLQRNGLPAGLPKV